MYLHSHHPQNLIPHTTDWYVSCLAILYQMCIICRFTWGMKLWINEYIKDFSKELFECIISAFFWREDTHNINTNTLTSEQPLACLPAPSTSYTHCRNAYLIKYSTWYAKLSTIMSREIKIRTPLSTLPAISPKVNNLQTNTLSDLNMTVEASTEYRTSNIRWQLQIK
jgi:hypothetical protein